MRTTANSWVRGLGLAVTLLGAVSCASHATPSTNEKASGSMAPVAAAAGRAASSGVEQSPAARARVDAARARFLLPSEDAAGVKGRPWALLHASTAARPALGADVATGFGQGGDYVRPEIPVAAKVGLTRTATVALPLRASDPVRVKDDTSNVAVSFALRGASDVPVAAAGGVAVYAGALGGADLMHRVHAAGTEDFVVFEQRPAKEEISYDVQLSRVAGLRLVSNTLEFLDAKGAPRLRVAPPYVVDGKGARSEGVISVQGCAVDASARSPFRRAVTAPGAGRCAVSVSWKAAAYPAMVDPSWTATGSMTTARSYPTATMLASGQVLVAGGSDSGGLSLSSAEVYDPPTQTFSATGVMSVLRFGQTATLLSSGAVLVAGGSDSDGNPTSSADLYDAGSGTFTATAALTTARSSHTATLLGSGNVLFAGGAIDASGDPTSSVEVYDAAGGTFAASGPLVAARQIHTATLLGSGSILIAGGFDGTSGMGSAELYDPVAGASAATGSMVAARFLDTATLLGSGSVLVVGGTVDGATPLSSAEIYTPSSGTFAATGSLTTARFGFTSGTLGTGQILVEGGSDGTNSLPDAELYNPAAGTFAATTSMTTGRYLLAAVALDSLDVLVVGGQDSSGVAVSSGEAFNAGLTITTDASSYSVGNPITVSWAGLPGNSNDFITIAPQGAPLTTITLWTYTGGSIAGSNTFNGGLNTAGTYVARAYLNGTWNLLVESTPFVVNAPSGTVSTDKTSYGPGDPIMVSWTGLPGNSTDYMTIAPQGSSVETITTWSYTGGVPSGSHTFVDGVAPGTYVARAFPNGSYALAGESIPFTVSSTSAVVTTDNTSYGPGNPITVTWSGLPGDSTDYITLAPQGSSDTTITTWVYTGGLSSGSHTFTGGLSTPGTYVARAFPNGTTSLAGESAAFTVVASSATLVTDLGTYSIGQDISVTWTGLPGNTYDYITLAPQGSPDSTITTWTYTGGLMSGAHTFAGGIASSGTYVARAYSNGTYSLLVQSASFLVQ